MAAYDVLAPHYDAVTGDPATESAFIGEIIAGRHGQAATLLDVACGTGGITALLAGTYRVSGLDISPGMLAVARAKLPGRTPLYLADMSRFRLDVKFDAIVSAYQGVNHLLSISAWKDFFGCASEHLTDAGVLVFDIATVGHLVTMANSPSIVQQFGDNYLRIRVRMTGRMVFDWRIEVFELQRDGKYKLITQSVQTRSFPLARIREALRPGFGRIEQLDGAGNPVGEDHDESADRIWFVCTRPARPRATGASRERSVRGSRDQRAAGVRRANG